MDRRMLRINLALKRGFDISLSAAAILMLVPVWIGIGIAIKADSDGPVIFVQERRTKDGKIFKMYKFRSMITGAENMGTRLINYKDDPRVTRVGRFLRNTSLDELPQLFNVLKGDISMVGPRPSVTYELGDYDSLNKRYKKRFSVLGGITGLAQVRGRNENSWDEKVTLDNQYIDEFQKRGIFLDIQILWETLIRVFKRSDIYEVKVKNGDEDVESARKAQNEIIRAAHTPDEEREIKYGTFDTKDQA